MVHLHIADEFLQGVRFGGEVVQLVGVADVDVLAGGVGFGRGVG